MSIQWIDYIHGATIGLEVSEDFGRFRSLYKDNFIHLICDEWTVYYLQLLLDDSITSDGDESDVRNLFLMKIVHHMKSELGTVSVSFVSYHASSIELSR
jgi:hypothetical protein